MLLALYTNDDYLPRGTNPKQPKQIFTPSDYLGKGIALPDGSRPLVRTSWIWPIIMAVDNINLPLMAHMSAFGNNDVKLLCMPKRMALEITSLPGKNKHGIPEIVVNKKPTVGTLWRRQLWSRSNGDVSAYGLFTYHGRTEPENQTKFWQNFILSNLKSAKAEAADEFVEAVENFRYAFDRSQLFSVIPEEKKK